MPRIAFVIAIALVLTLPSAARAERNVEIGRTWIDIIGNLHILVRAKNTSGEVLSVMEVECSVEAGRHEIVGLGRAYIEGPVMPRETRPAEIIVQLGGAAYREIQCVTSGRL